MRVEDFVLAHAKYKISLRKFVENGSEINVSDEDLLFWIHEQESCWGHLSSFHSLRRDHEAFCQYVAAVLTLVEDGRKEEAAELLRHEMFILLSNEVVKAVSSLAWELNHPAH